MTRAEAIEWLRSAGMNASARDWAMGKTILITVGKPDQVGGHHCLSEGSVYVCPEADGRWTLLDCFFLDSRSRLADFDIKRRYADLASAAKAARDYVMRVEPAVKLQAVHGVELGELRHSP